MSWENLKCIEYLNRGIVFFVDNFMIFTDFAQNSLKINMGIFFLTSNLMEAARGQKHPSEAKHDMKESIYGKKCLMKVA